MHDVRLLLKKDFLVFHNRYLDSPQKKQKLFLILLLVIGGFIAIGHYFSIDLAKSLENETPKDAALILGYSLFSIIFMFNFFQFFTSMTKLLPNFYESPDIHYLVSTPLSSKSILFYKLLNHTFKVVRSESIIAVPMIFFLGLNVNANLGFFILFPIIYFLIACLACLIGMVIGIIYLKRFSSKSYKIVAGSFQFMYFALIWALFVFKLIDFDKLLALIAHPIFTDYVIHLIPAYTGSQLLANLALGQWLDAFIMGLYFISTSLFYLGLILTMVNKSFSKGLMNTGIISQKKARKGKSGPYTLKAVNRSPVYALICTQWKNALYNFQLLPTALLFYGLYIGLIVALIAIFKVPATLGIILLYSIGFLFVNTGTEILLLPPEATTNPMLEKSRFSLLKMFPLSTLDYMKIRLLSAYIPSVLLLSFGAMIFCFIQGFSLIESLFCVAIQAIVFMGFSIQSKGMALYAHAKTSESVNWFYSLLTMFISIFANLMVFGFPVLYALKGQIQIEWVSHLSLTSALILPILYMVFQYVYFFRLGTRSWQKTEF